MYILLLQALTPILEAIIKLINTLVDRLGAGVTLGIIIAVFLFWLGWKIYQEIKNEKEKRALIEEKDRHIQRLAAECRYYRILDLKSRGWTDKQIKEFVVENDFNNPVEARKALENKKNNNKQLATGNKEEKSK